jgi:hypothetical protein
MGLWPVDWKHLEVGVAYFQLLLLILPQRTEENDERKPITIFLRKFKLEISVHFLVDRRSFP